MASPSRHRPRHLIEELRHDATPFSFFQAVRLLRWNAKTRGQTHGALPAGLRFRTPASLAFPPSELTEYRPVATAREMPNEQDELEVPFMGLTGPSGVLPVAYTELLINRRLRERDSAGHAFFDLFSHRAIALFYGAWSKYRHWINAEVGEADGFTRNVLDFSGLGLGHLRSQLRHDANLDENLFVFYAGQLSRKPLSAQTLAVVIQGFFGIPAQLEQFVGQWINLPDSEQTRLGSQACELGLSAFVGERIWDRQTKLRLRLGPMRRAEFDAMQANGPGAAAVKALLQFALGHTLAADVTLVLARTEVPAAQLVADAPLRLGGNGWLESARDRTSDPDDMRYSALS